MLHMYHAEFPQVELWKMHNMLQQFESEAQLLYVCIQWNIRKKTQESSMTKKKQTRNICVNVTLKCVFVTTVSMESSK